MLQKITWPMVVVALAVLGCLTAIILVGRDPAVLINFLLLVLGAPAMVGLYGKMSRVEQQTNGQQHRMMSIVENVAAQGVPPIPTSDTVGGQGISAKPPQ